MRGVLRGANGLRQGRGRVMNEEQCRLCGYWVDEGSLSSRGFCGICQTAFEAGLNEGSKNA